MLCTFDCNRKFEQFRPECECRAFTNPYVCYGLCNTQRLFSNSWGDIQLVRSRDCFRGNYCNSICECCRDLHLNREQSIEQLQCNKYSCRKCKYRNTEC
jgi:hypothetical protein